MTEKGETEQNQIKTEEDSLNKTWGDTTDPNNHNPDQYRYLVHGINLLSKMSKLIATQSAIEAGLTYDESWGDQTISMYDRPEELGNRVSVSMSLIDQDHTGTWGDAGLIIEAPECNVVLTSSTDMGAVNDNRDFLLGQARQHPVMSGDVLLKNSSSDSYNEVVAVGTNPDSQQPLRLAGFFYKVTPYGEVHDRALVARMQAHATHLGLPIVSIVEKGPYTTDGFHRNIDAYYGRESISVTHGGKLYRLAGHDPQYSFMTCDSRMHNSFISPDEIELVLSYALSQGGITEQEATDIRESYIVTDKQRQTPKVEFDSEGNVKRIIYLTGYGDAETEVSIGQNGYGYKTNLKRLSEHISTSMLGSNSLIKPSMPLSPIEANSMIQEACQTLDAAQSALVQQWFKEHCNILEENWANHIKTIAEDTTFDKIKDTTFGKTKDITFGKSGLTLPPELTKMNVRKREVL